MWVHHLRAPVAANVRAHMGLTKYAGLWAPWIGVALWALFFAQWFVVCPLVDAPHPPKFEPGGFCRLNSAGWFVGLLIVPLVTGVIGLRQMSLSTKVLFGLVVVLPCFALLLRWAYVTYAP